MNTTFHFTISTQGTHHAGEVLKEAHRLVAQTEKELSEFLVDSPVYKLNHSKPFEPTPVALSFLDVWRLCEEVRHISDGFNCLSKSKNDGKIHIDASAVAFRENEDTHVGFGAIGKGYALDLVREHFVREGFSEFCLSAGGSSIILSGFKTVGIPWDFAWSWENGRGLALEHASGEPIAIGVSGVSTQPEHLIDPKEKLPSHAVMTSLVGHKSAAMADALSTALFVRGFEDSLGKFEKCLDKPAIAVIEHGGVPRWNGIFQNWWGALSALSFFCVELCQGSEEIIDFSDVSEFTPYITSHHPIWIALPLVTLAWVFWHLQEKTK